MLLVRDLLARTSEFVSITRYTQKLAAKRGAIARSYGPKRAPLECPAPKESDHA
jgi:hypothetical protein